MRYSCLVIITAVAIATSGCRRQSPPQPETRQTQAAATTTVAQRTDLRNANINILPPPPEYVQKSNLGTKLGSDGMVAETRTTFKSGETPALSMWFNESPGGLHSSAMWYSGEKEIAADRRPMNGAKTVTFAYNGKKLRPGTYRVVGYWGGNIAAEYEFKVTK